MKKLCTIVLFTAALIVSPLATQAQGFVGGIVGAAAGTVGGILGARRHHSHRYARREHRPIYSKSEELREGSFLPATGIEYYDVPAEFHVGPGDRYAIVNGHPVLVDVETRRVVEILD
jgi:hypothetical protein